MGVIQFLVAFAIWAGITCCNAGFLVAKVWKSLAQDFFVADFETLVVANLFFLLMFVVPKGVTK